MHVIDVCPRCGQDYMRHSSDTPRLSRPVGYDPVTGEPCSFEVVCHDCHDKETTERMEHNRYPLTKEDCFEPVRQWQPLKTYDGKVFKRSHLGFWLNLRVISVYASVPGMILVIRLFMFSGYSGVFTLKISLWSDQQIAIGINKKILMFCNDQLIRLRRRLARIRS